MEKIYTLVYPRAYKNFFLFSFLATTTHSFRTLFALIINLIKFNQRKIKCEFKQKFSLMEFYMCWYVICYINIHRYNKNHNKNKTKATNANISFSNFRTRFVTLI